MANKLFCLKWTCEKRYEKCKCQKTRLLFISKEVILMTLCQLTLYDTLRHQIEDPSGSVRNYSYLVNQILECKGVTWTAHIHIMLTPSWYVHTLATTLCVGNYVTHYTSVSESSVVTFYTESYILRHREILRPHLV